MIKWILALVLMSSAAVADDLTPSQLELIQIANQLLRHEYRSQDNKRMNYLQWIGSDKNVRPTVIIPGRGEISYQYTETMRDLRKQGFKGEFYVWDPKGQGLSERLIEGKETVGHIDRFAEYTSELELFLRRVVEKHGMKVNLIAHSMGGAISIDHVLQNTNLVDRLVLDAPMLRIKLTGTIFDGLIRTSFKALSSLGLGRLIIFGEKKKGDLPKEFNVEKTTTNSKSRWHFKMFLHRKYGTYLPGKTLQWVAESMRKIKNLQQRAKNLTVETVLFIGKQDRVIDTDGQRQFGCNAPSCRVIELDGKHALHEERDSFRGQKVREKFIEETARFISVPLAVLRCERALVK